jgi:hypothetical protein
VSFILHPLHLKLFNIREISNKILIKVLCTGFLTNILLIRKLVNFYYSAIVCLSAWLAGTQVTVGWVLSPLPEHCEIHITVSTVQKEQNSKPELERKCKLKPHYDSTSPLLE